MEEAEIYRKWVSLEGIFLAGHGDRESSPFL